MEKVFTREDYINKQNKLREDIINKIVDAVSIAIETALETRYIVLFGSAYIHFAINRLRVKYPFLAFTERPNEPTIYWELKGE